MRKYRVVILLLSIIFIARWTTTILADSSSTDKSKTFMEYINDMFIPESEKDSANQNEHLHNTEDSQKTTPISIQTEETQNILFDIEGHWAEDAVLHCYNSDMVNVYSDNTIRPDSPFTRGEFAYSFEKWMQIKSDLIKELQFTYSDKSVKFTDVYSNQYNYTQVLSMAKKGLFSDQSNKFRPDDGITREEASVVWTTFIKGLKNSTIDAKYFTNLNAYSLLSKYADYNAITDWSREALALMSDKKFISGYADNTLQPTRVMTRAEGYTMFYNIEMGLKDSIKEKSVKIDKIDNQSIIELTKIKANNTSFDGFNIEFTVNDIAIKEDAAVIFAYTTDSDYAITEENIADSSIRAKTKTVKLDKLDKISDFTYSTWVSASFPGSYYIYALLKTDSAISELASYTLKVDLPSDKTYSLLTGKPIDKSKAQIRPVSVVIDNQAKALPQSGISQADIYYETLVEGGITRLLTVFQDFDAKKIGPVRSSRHYFMDFSLDNDSIHIHHGGSELAYKSIETLNVNNIDAIKDKSKIFWRDYSKESEHNSYTSTQEIKRAIEEHAYRNTISTSQIMFKFLEPTGTLEGYANGRTSSDITVPFSINYISKFEYDSEKNIYYRYLDSKPQIDEITGEQLSVTNIIVQYTDIYSIKNDNEGRKDVELVGNGNGLLVTNGQVFNIHWKKQDHQTPTSWTFEDGKELKLYPGKTWICVFPKDSILPVGIYN